VVRDASVVALSTAAIFAERVHRPSRRLTRGQGAAPYLFSRVRKRAAVMSGSAEYPEWVCDSHGYNDQLIALLTPPPAGSYVSAGSAGGNISFDGNHHPVSVDLGFCDACDPATPLRFASHCKTVGGACPRCRVPTARSASGICRGLAWIRGMGPPARAAPRAGSRLTPLLSQEGSSPFASPSGTRGTRSSIPRFSWIISSGTRRAEPWSSVRIRCPRRADRIRPRP
jgi:hypothetical protein